MKELVLSNGMISLVDDDIFDEYSKYTWSADLDKTTGNYYVCRKFYIGHWREGKRYKSRLHRIVIGAEKGQMVDHINRNTLDNRKENLRIVTNSQNRMNIKKRCDASSQYKGVYWSNQYKMYLAQIRKDGKLYRLGKFKSETEAAVCYNNAAKEMFGEFACLNDLSGKE